MSRAGVKRREFLAIMRKIPEGRLMDVLTSVAVRCSPKSIKPRPQSNVVHLFNAGAPQGSDDHPPSAA
jgi:hypothetical protein